MADRMILTALPDFPLVKPGDDLAILISDGISRAKLTLEHQDVIIIASKVVSKAEGRLVDLKEITPSSEAEHLGRETLKDPRLVEVILRDSRQVVRKHPGLIIVEHRLGFICANAGVDHSNVVGMSDAESDWVLPLPINPDDSAQKIRAHLEQVSGIKLGVLIVDSHGRAWRMGTTGVAIGVAGLPALLDLRGRADLFGYVLQATQVGLVDEIASAGSILMGQADEGRPVIHLRGLPYDLREGNLQEILRPEKEDLFR